MLIKVTRKQSKNIRKPKIYFSCQKTHKLFISYSAKYGADG